MQSAARITAQYRHWIEAHLINSADADLALQVDAVERRLHIIGLGAERNEVLSIARSGELTGGVDPQVGREIDLLEARYNTR